MCGLARTIRARQGNRRVPWRADSLGWPPTRIGPVADWLLLGAQWPIAAVAGFASSNGRKRPIAAILNPLHSWGMINKPWTYESRKRCRRKRLGRDGRPNRFRFRASLKEVGGIARLLRLHGFEVTVPARISPSQWTITAVVPEQLSAARLLRLCNLIDRSRTLAPLTSVNVRVFRWLGKDRRQPPHFYRSRNGSYPPDLRHFAREDAEAS